MVKQMEIMALSHYFNKPRPIPLIMSVTAVLTLFFLGGWQVKRLIWKEALLTQLEHAAQTAPLQALPDDVDAHRFYRVQLVGRFLPEHEFHLAARYFKSQLGYSVLVPFKLAKTGQVIMVSRGWIPAASKDANNHPPAPEGERTILAQIRTSNDRNPFTPINQPEKNIWFGRDTTEMGAKAGLDVLPYTLDVIGDQNPAILPVPSNGELKPRNDHLHYAITWFAVGFSALIISLLYHRKKPSIT